MPRREDVGRAGRAAADSRGNGNVPTLPGDPAARSPNILDLFRAVGWLLAVCLVGATVWALVILAMIGVFL